jgi:hypothetical protein
VSGGGNANTFQVLDSAEIYDPGTNQWIATPPMPSATRLPVVVRLQDGRVLATGGHDFNGNRFNQAALFTP